MGCSSSKTNLVPYARGNEKDFRERFVEENVLGQGEFGVVKKCIDLHARAGDENKRVAVKVLRKGMTFKDNTVYLPLKPEVLQLECGILKDLGGRNFIPELFGVWESSSLLYIVTEVCYGGEMMQYIAKAHSDDLSTEDVSRISFELLKAMDHCAAHGVIHRDLKPENIMFRSTDKGSSLRVIDFGCACRDKIDNPEVDPPSSDDTRHTTFAGTAFYISPEMFQRNYNFKTDIWGIGVTLYVLVAGYPAHELQKAFNMLQSSDRNLRELPDMPQNELPDSYFKMLSQLLTYKSKQRVSAKDLLENDEFVNFHKKTSDGALQVSAQADQVSPLQPFVKRTSSILSSTSYKHSAYLQYEKFERSVTALLAAILSQKQLSELVEKLGKSASENDSSEDPSRFTSETANRLRLKVITIGKLKHILDELEQQECSEMVNNLPNAANYEGYAYHWNLLQQFTEETSNNAASYAKQAELDNSMGRRTRSLITLTRKSQKDLLDLSDHGGSNTEHAEKEHQNNSSVHGSSIFASIKRKRTNARKMDALNVSSHF